ncbi:MAG: hypothetical protein ABJF67_16845 [Aurantimonas coralicida]
MTKILASTADHFVEYDPASGGCPATFVVVRRSDGRAKGATGKPAIRVRDEFIESLTTHSPEEVVRVFLDLFKRLEWEGYYKADVATTRYLAA